MKRKKKKRKRIEFDREKGIKARMRKKDPRYHEDRERFLNKSDFKKEYSRQNYFLVVKKILPGIEVHDIVNHNDYISCEKLCYQITGVAGENKLVTKQNLISDYLVFKEKEKISEQHLTELDAGKQLHIFLKTDNTNEKVYVIDSRYIDHELFPEINIFFVWNLSERPNKKNLRIVSRKIFYKLFKRIE